jgi:hypothetical protein
MIIDAQDSDASGVCHIFFLIHMPILEQVPLSANPIWSPLFGSIVAQRCSFEPEKALPESRELAPWVSQIDALPAEEPGAPRAPRHALWIANPNVAGGKEINKAAFTTPTGPVQGDLGRNALRGFDATQVDLTLRRQFKLHDRLALQARADVFNIFNHPNFGPPTNYLSSPLFGQSTQMLGASLGSGGQNGGLNPLYQIGGPRSVQLALKLQF